MNMLSAVASFFKDGGVFMYFILGIGAFIAAIVVERLIVIAGAAGGGRKLTEDLAQRIARGDLNGARQVASSSNRPVAKVAQAILHAAPADEAVLQSAADDAATLILPQLSRRLAHLAVLANSATLLGLLGTIFGLMTAFSGVSAADPAQRSAFLAAGISQALNTTAFGLIIAVPALLVQGFLIGRVEGIAEQLDEASIRLSRSFAHASDAGTRRAPLQVVKPGSAVAAQPVALRPTIGTGR